MKRFDAVKTMRDIRTQLSERYNKDAKRQFEDLRRIREKYDISPDPHSIKKTHPKTAVRSGDLKIKGA